MEARTIDFGGIGWSVNHMRHGHRMRRRIWRDKSIWVGYADNRDTRLVEPGTGSTRELLPMRPMLIMKNADGTIGPWSAGQADLLAADWEIFEDPHRAAA